jgi:hypothetical protein
MVLLLLPYIYPALLLPRVEELNYSLYPLILWVKQVLNGETPLWCFNAGLGIPWPVPHTMSHTPLMLLFGFFPAYVALAFLLTVHIALQSFFTLRLCAYFKLTPIISMVVLVSVLLAAPMEYLIASDAAAVYLSWTLLPIILYALLKLLDSTSLAHLLGYSSLLAFSVGYGIVNGHTGMFSPYLISLFILALSQYKSVIHRWPWFLFSAILGLGIGAEKIYILAYELSYFGSHVPRMQYSFEQSLRAGLWNLFLKPILLSKHIFSTNYMDKLIRVNSVSRALTFGSPLCTILLSSYAFFWLWYKKMWSTIPAIQKGMWLTLGFCFFAQFTPKFLLPNFISASWSFRDPAILIGLLLAGIICDTWLRPRLRPALYYWLLGIHLILLVISALCFHYNINWRSDNQGKPSRLYNALSMGMPKYPLHEMLDRALECHKDKSVCKEQSRRVVYDGLAAFYAHRSIFPESGLHLNSLPLYGYSEVSFLTKGLSLDAIHPSSYKPYGMITTLSFPLSSYKPDEYDWVQQSPALLNILGIRAVVGKDYGTHPKNGLLRVGVLNSEGIYPYEKLAVYANPTAFPNAFFVNSLELANVKRNGKCPEGENSLTCMDFSQLVASTNPWSGPIHVKETMNRISMRFTPSSQSRVALMSYMWRPEWKAKGAKIDPFYGLIKLTIPPHTSSATLEYDPVLFIYARWLTIVCLGIAILFSGGLCGWLPFFTMHRTTRK